MTDDPNLNQTVRVSKLTSAPWSVRIAVYFLSVASSTLLWRNDVTFTEGCVIVRRKGWWPTYLRCQSIVRRIALPNSTMFDRFNSVTARATDGTYLSIGCPGVGVPSTS